MAGEAHVADVAQVRAGAEGGGCTPVVPNRSRGGTTSTSSGGSTVACGDVVKAVHGARQDATRQGERVRLHTEGRVAPPAWRRR